MELNGFMGAFTAYGTVVVVLVDLRWTLPTQSDCDELDWCMTTSRKILSISSLVGVKTNHDR